MDAFGTSRQRLKDTNHTAGRRYRPPATNTIGARTQAQAAPPPAAGHPPTLTSAYGSLVVTRGLRRPARCVQLLLGGGAFPPTRTRTNTAPLTLAPLPGSLRPCRERTRRAVKSIERTDKNHAVPSRKERRLRSRGGVRTWAFPFNHCVTRPCWARRRWQKMAVKVHCLSAIFCRPRAPFRQVPTPDPQTPSPKSGC